MNTDSVAARRERRQRRILVHESRKWVQNGTVNLVIGKFSDFQWRSVIVPIFSPLHTS